MEDHFDSEDLNLVKKRKKDHYQVEDKVVAHVRHEQCDLPVTLQFQWCQMEVHFDIEDLHRVKDKILAHLRHELGDLPAGVEVRGCRISKFDDEDKAWMVRDILLTMLGHFGPYVPPPFQVEADSSWYISFITEGVLFKPSREKLYKSFTLYDDGHVFFPSNSYKSILREIIASVWRLSGTQLRCRISLENIYIVKHDGIVWNRATYAKFLRFDLQEHIMDDKVEVREKLRKLFEEINSKCNVDDGSKAEFDLFLKNFSLDHPLDVYDNVFFWKKYQRMNFIDRILELSRSGNIVIYGDETKDAFEEDWESKLRSHPDIPLFLELNRRFTKPSSFDDTRGAPDASMKKCIETIRDLYFNFECLKQQLEDMGVKPKLLQDAEQVVDYIHYIFPYLIGALAERAFAMEWPLNMSFEPKLVLGLF
ncbi:uncharacterized protein LOC119985631 [Tripterygium wilfordii]|uniref:uncharacterized protein LOC119985631 n=1 Tax=Tripterygium wilfordii TaxID=458696 RepID=UPI0018F7EAB7|nr:uncharacterized protein LOC119985631 [Tripterygium wilfordii]XP_038685847.1 uncharacterized protein LOC119985631 [Tripterygium wilfordii]XP_038685848.1 uncharacterized protein LOC119985631 [Tripterygium wilfordii]